MRTYQPVMLSNGKMYESGNEAGKAIGVDSGSIWSAINKRHRVKDLTVIKITNVDLPNILMIVGNSISEKPDKDQ